MKQDLVTSETCCCFFDWVLSFHLWCLGQVCRPRCWFVSDKSSSVPNNSSYTVVLLNNIWIQGNKEITVMKDIFANMNATIFLSSSCSWLQELPSIALRANWKFNRDHRARLVSSNRDWFAYYIDISYSLFAGDTINASSAGAITALQGTWSIHPSCSRC